VLWTNLNINYDILNNKILRYIGKVYYTLHEQFIVLNKLVKNV